ncbi:DUF5627 domain-containing protein [Bacteroides sp. 51]|uniref:DUF5627 domain-containing protein n=1 Tax=Bacteroides sp. 51 TaxID=2302938 RepID=UPI0013D8D829|nr:DUF5627 domain-containing protein [Bacteroides sp. 51]NDV81617.1 DUF1735 domain-containing protein [Bacteroides sp. 51]
MKKNKRYIWLVFIATLITSCSNQDVDFPDFDYQTVYFANQYYARTIELGEDLYVDNSIDNEHKMLIKATVGGTRNNDKKRTINFKVDESLCNNLYFVDNDNPVVPMPASYYKLAGNQIVIPSGALSGGVEVELTDAFFEDPKSLTTNYVIPLVMTDVQGADSILQGNPQLTNPDRCIGSDWTVLPKDFVLCAVKYVNPWHAIYVRRGVDQITTNSTTTTNVRHKQYVENDEEVNITTNSLTKGTLALNIKDSEGYTVNYDVLLNFTDDGICSVSGSTDSYEISGSGKFVSKGEKNSIGGLDRDALYLEYNVDFKNLNMKYATKDTLVVRNRGIIPEYFSVERK